MHLDDSWILFPIHKDEKLYIVPEVIYIPLSFLFSLSLSRCRPPPPPLSFCFYLFFPPSRLLCFSALFVGVLEKTVEGESTALTKAKTLYKSCTNESESAGIRYHQRLFFVSPSLLKWTFSYCHRTLCVYHKFSWIALTLFLFINHSFLNARISSKAYIYILYVLITKKIFACLFKV